jgi:hypothetical protein
MQRTMRLATAGVQSFERGMYARKTFGIRVAMHPLSEPSTQTERSTPQEVQGAHLDYHQRSSQRLINSIRTSDSQVRCGHGSRLARASKVVAVHCRHWLELEKNKYMNIYRHIAKLRTVRMQSTVGESFFFF